MSTYYRPTEKISLSKIKKMKEFEVVYIKEQDAELFFDGENYLHFATNQEGNVIDVFRYGGNDPTNILDALESKFGVAMFSEYEDEYHNLEDQDTPVIQFSIE